MKWLLLLILLLLLTELRYQLWLGQGNYGELQALQAMVEQQRRENLALQQRNEVLAAEIKDLKQGTEAIEERARLDFGMIKPGEIFYQIVEE